MPDLEDFEGIDLDNLENITLGDLIKIKYGDDAPEVIKAIQDCLDKYIDAMKDKSKKYTITDLKDCIFKNLCKLNMEPKKIPFTYFILPLIIFQ
jgi:hypothetical protein